MERTGCRHIAYLSNPMFISGVHKMNTHFIKKAADRKRQGNLL